jgi:DNA mismatch repair protein MSH6
MACEVASTPGGSEEVTFLYKLVMGACPKSYGVNVARLAGMPESILQRAGSRSAQLELAFECNNKKEITDKVVDLSEEELLKELQYVLKKSQMCDHDPIIMRRLLLLWEQGKQVITDNGTNRGSQPTPGCPRENHSNFSKRQESPIRSCY